MSDPTDSSNAELIATVKKQSLSTELDHEEYESADFEGAYDAILCDARKLADALAAAEETISNLVHELKNYDPNYAAALDRLDELEPLLAERESALAAADAERSRVLKINEGLVHDFNVLLIHESRSEDRAKAAESALSRARSNALEEAAKAADGWLVHFGDREIKHTSPHQYASDAVRDVADAIRALITKETA